MPVKSGSSSSTRTAMRHKCGFLSMFKQAGAAAVEFAIVLPLLILIIGGIIEFGRVFWYFDALTKATRDGARYISTAPIPLNSGAPATVARSIVTDAATKAGLPSFTSGNVNITCTPDCNVPDPVPAGTPYYVTVAITGYSVAFGSWFVIPLPAGDWPLTPHTTMRYMCTESTRPC